MSAVIKLEDLTIDQMRKFQWIKMNWDENNINDIINKNTYYRIIKNDFKYWAHPESLEKLRKALKVSKEV